MVCLVDLISEVGEVEGTGDVTGCKGETLVVGVWSEWGWCMIWVIIYERIGKD